MSPTVQESQPQIYAFEGYGCTLCDKITLRRHDEIFEIPFRGMKWSVYSPILS